MTVANHIKQNSMLLAYGQLCIINSLTATQSEASIVSKLLANSIEYGRADLREWREVEKRVFNLCDPATPESKIHFDYLNEVRDNIRRMEKDLENLENFMRKLKKQVSANTSSGAVLDTF